MSVCVEVDLNGVRVPILLDDDALATIAAALPNGTREPEAASPYLTVREAAELLRCDRQRIDDLLSQQRLTRIKDGRRTLVRRAELDTYLNARQRRTG